MPIATENTRFTRDALGRYLCNTFQEAMDSSDPGKFIGARPFNVVIIGGGTFGSVLAQHLFARDTTRKYRILVLEAGPFLLPEHVQNLPMSGLGVPSPTSIKDLRDAGAFGTPRQEVWGLAWHSPTKFTGLAYCVGGRSLYWGGWSPVLLDTEVASWPPAAVGDLRSRYFREAAEQIGVTESNDFIEGELHARLRSLLRSAIDQGTVSSAVPLAQLPDQVDVPSDVPAAERPSWKLEAPLAVQAKTRGGFFPCNKFSAVPLLTKAVRAAFDESGGNDSKRRLMVVPNCHIKRLQASGGRVTGVETGQGVVPVPSDAVVVLALGTVENARLGLLLQADGVPIVGTGANLMAHLRSNLTIRVPRASLEAQGALPTELAASALFVKGRVPLSGGATGHFHLQITAAGLGPTGADSEAELFKKVPDLDTFEVLRQANDTNAVVTIRGIGEMQANNPNSFVGLDPEADEYGTPRAFVSIQAGAADQELWDTVDRAADDVALAFANGSAYEVMQGGAWKPVAAGARASTVFPFPGRRDVLGSTHHESGTLRMGTNTAASVTDANGRFHACSNLYAAGPALFPTIGSPNPMLTGVALCRRLADQLTAGAALTPEAGFTALFDGSEASFRKWQAVGSGSFWLADGCLIAEPGSDLGLLYFTAQRFGDFTLRLQFRLNAPWDNSGVFVRSRDPRLPVPDRDPSTPRHEYANKAWVPVTTGFEIQIDQIGQPDGAREHQTGAVYNVPIGTARGQQACGPLPAAPPGNWNDMEVVVRGDTYTVTVNGAPTSTFTNPDAFRGKSTSLDPASGFIGLQAHTGRVAFRGIRIKPDPVPVSARGTAAVMVESRPEQPAVTAPHQKAR